MSYSAWWLLRGGVGCDLQGTVVDQEVKEGLVLNVGFFLQLQGGEFSNFLEMFSPWEIWDGRVLFVSLLNFSTGGISLIGFRLGYCHIQRCLSFQNPLGGRLQGVKVSMAGFHRFCDKFAP